MNRESTSVLERSEMGGRSATDPVCGMQVQPDTAFSKLDHEGKTYYFCCARCLEKFTADPEKYAGSDSQA